MNHISNLKSQQAVFPAIPCVNNIHFRKQVSSLRRSVHEMSFYSPTAAPHTRILWGVMSMPVLCFEASSSRLHNPGWSTMKTFFDRQLLELEMGEKNLKEMLLDMDCRSLSSHVTLVSRTQASLQRDPPLTKTFNICLTVLMFSLHKNKPQNTCSVSNKLSLKARL